MLARVATTIGANIFYSRLRGYGTATEEIVDVAVNDWVNDAWEAVRIGHRLGKRVVVAGSSMGADLALWAATQPGAGIDGLVLFSTAVRPREKLILAPWPFNRIILAIAFGRHMSNAFRTDLYPTGSAELYARYNPSRYRVGSLLKLVAVMRLTGTLPLGSITAPSLWLYNEKDDALDISALKTSYGRTGGAGKRLVSVPDARGHMLAGDMWQPETTDEVVRDILGFLRDAGLASEHRPESLPEAPRPLDHFGIFHYFRLV